MKKICLTLIGLIFFFSFSILAEEALQEFISFGADLTKEQRSQLYDQFAPLKRPQMIEVTNAEEVQYLQDYVPKNQIGSKAISSVYLRILSANSGIQVQTENITWVTSGMYANAVATAGVKDVLIKANSPFSVSGTAALTGIFKTFELAQGQPITSERKEVAYQELVTTGELGEDIGQNNAETLIRDVKKEVITKEITDPEEMEVIIKEKAAEYNLEITDQQLQQIIVLLEKINHLDINIDEITKQLQKLNTEVQGMEKKGQKVVGLLAQILSLLQKIFDFIRNLFR